VPPPPARAGSGPGPSALRRRRPWTVVGATLADFGARFPAAERLSADPVRLVHAYSRDEDREVAALVASSLAFGRVGSLVAKAGAALEALGPSPSATARRLRPGEIPPGLARWKHRWVSARDLAWLVAAAGRVQREHGSLGAAFSAAVAASPPSPHLLEPMARFAALLRPEPEQAWHGGPPGPGARYLVPVPDGRSAAKRLCLLLRWMVRPADGVDLGLWPDVDPARLTVPVDTHVARIGGYLGLTDRLTADWRAARDITESLRRFDPKDPTRHDFALAHLGIMGACPRRRDVRRCAACDLVPACRL
jgi:uncharacterized protein (TIGR02757 family)